MAVALLALAFLAGCATPRPDFSGEWEQSRERTRFGLESLQELEEATLEVRHDDDELHLERVFVLGGVENRVALHLVTDGMEREQEVQGRRICPCCWWEGEVLVFRTRIPGEQGESVNTVHYRLLEEGRVLVGEERFRGPGLEYENLWVFERR